MIWIVLVSPRDNSYWLCSSWHQTRLLKIRLVSTAPVVSRGPLLQVRKDLEKALGMTTIRFNPDPDCTVSDHLITRFPDLLDIAQMSSKTETT